MKADALPVLQSAASDGAASAWRQLDFYGITRQKKPAMSAQIKSAYDVIDTKVQAQEAALMALLLGGADEGLILGDEERQGVLRPVDILAAGAFWIAALFWDAFSQTSARAGGFQKQVVAAIDMRTTETCLRAHGQVVGFNESFHLAGTPRYADYLDWTPFHNYCRSSVVLYLPEYDDGLTERMQESSAKVLEERARGEWRDKQPADAFLLL